MQHSTLLRSSIALFTMRCPVKGMTLTEIVLAIVLLALTFIPIMNVLGTTIKGNQKEEKVVKAIHLAQTKLNAAIQFPFNDIPTNNGGLGTYGGVASWSYATNSNLLVLNLGPEGEFRTSLTIANEPISFTHQIYDPTLKAANPRPENRKVVPQSFLSARPIAKYATASGVNAHNHQFHRNIYIA